MDCIDSVPKIAEANLLTQADKITQLEQVFVKYRHKNDIFLPGDSFYSPFGKPEDVERMADSIFKWLGIKHRSIAFHIDPKQDRIISYGKQGATFQIVLGWKCQQDPFLCGAAVAHAIAHHLLIGRAKINLGNTEENEELADLGTIYAGLGVIVMNSFDGSSNALGSMAQPNYVAECIDYFKERSIVPSMWQPYVLPDVIEENIPDKLPSSRYASYIRDKLARHSDKNKRLILAGFAAIVVIVTGTFVYSSRPRYLSAEMQNYKDSAAILKTQVQKCEETVKRKQETWDKTDIFMLRQIEADQSRCTSLKNRYNYEVTQYNSRL